MTQDTTVRTRMAPSPTGEYHVGHIATLLKNYAFAHKHGGQFVLRIEDTDQERKVEGAVEKILKVITDYGLDWDEGPQKEGPFGPYVQSERLPLYEKYAKMLVDNNQAYYCFCSRDRLTELRDQQRANKQQPRYDRHCRNLSLDEVAAKLEAGEEHVIRLKVPDNQDITFTDLIRGDITFNSSEVDDQVLMKSDGFPTYHLAVVVDDHLMEISHVMRGEEWISSTPKHVLLYQAFGWEPPVYAHIPVFLNPDGKGKMSKRKGTVSAQSFLDDGYLPEALLNFFMILGWTREDEREIMSLEEYIHEFDPARISAKSVVFDLKKLAWVNGQYIRKLSFEELLEKLAPHIPDDFPKDKVENVVPLIHDRLEKLSDFDELTTFFYKPFERDANFSRLLNKKATPDVIALQLEATQQALSKITDWSHESIETVIRDLQEQNEWKKGQYFMMLRIASTGRKATPPLFETMAAIGQEIISDRLIAAQQSLKN
jgi:glutamyl-tRNA synthetase